MLKVDRIVGNIGPSDEGCTRQTAACRAIAKCEILRAGCALESHGAAITMACEDDFILDVRHYNATQILAGNKGVIKST